MPKIINRASREEVKEAVAGPAKEMTTRLCALIVAGKAARVINHPYSIVVARRGIIVRTRYA